MRKLKLRNLKMPVLSVDLLRKTIENYGAFILVATLIVAVLASLPMFVYNKYRTWRYDLTIEKLEIVQKGLKVYRDEHGKFPMNLKVLAKFKKVRYSDIRDGWGNPLRYWVDEIGLYHLESLGSDGFEGPEDYELEKPVNYIKVPSTTDITAPFLPTLHDFERYNDDTPFIGVEERKGTSAYLLYWGSIAEKKRDTNTALTYYHKALKMGGPSEEISKRIRHVNSPDF